ncbi:type 4a pilus biogenesis protein PilO [Clostridium baratii]|uniref:Pilus assembly protein, PilO n=1 Tax=Clostridium baratii TaxID=1561 RepID=A0A174V5F9_9CLOT|nr:type 4a pilus biogenesis protein PilO [Clostridium baratii]CUQ27348.1 Pilus assembly protein%2C PilO [Clostridium baratii]
MLKMNKDNRELSKNEKILLGVIGILSILAICYVFIIQPSFNKTKTIVKENERLSKEIESVKNIENEINNKNKELESLNVEYKQASESLPEVDRYPSLANDLNNMAQKNKLSIKSSKYDEAKIFESQANQEQTQTPDQESSSNQKTNELLKSLTGLKYLDVSLELNGNENDVINFVDELEKTDRMLVIDTLKLNEKTSSIRIIYYISGQKEIEQEKYDFN